MKEAFLQSLQNLRANKLRSVLTMFGILWGMLSVVVLSATHDRATVNASLAAGARGFIAKTANAAELLDAVRQCIDGLEYLTPDVMLEPDGDGARLTYTEQAVHLDGLDTVEGREEGTREILERLGSVLAGSH